MSAARLPRLLGITLGIAALGALALFGWKQSLKGREESSKRGDTLLKMGMAREAEQAWTQAIQQNPADPKPRLALAQFYLDRRQYRQAGALYRSVTQMPVVPPHTFCFLAQCEWRLGENVSALKDAEEETRRDPNCARGHLIAGQICRRESRANDALAHLRQAARLAPNEMPIQLVYASVLAKTDQYAEAETLLKQIIAKEPLHADPFYWLGYCYSRHDSLPDHTALAESNLLRARSMEPESPETNYELARLDLNVHKPADALKFATEAVRLRRHYPEALFTLAQAQRANGQTEAADRTLQMFRVESDLNAREKALLRTLATNRQDVPTLLALADVEKKRDNLPNARAVLAEAARLAPNAPEVRAALDAETKQMPVILPLASERQENDSGASNP